MLIERHRASKVARCGIGVKLCKPRSQQVRVAIYACEAFCISCWKSPHQQIAARTTHAAWRFLLSERSSRLAALAARPVSAGFCLNAGRLRRAASTAAMQSRVIKLGKFRPSYIFFVPRLAAHVSGNGSVGERSSPCLPLSRCQKVKVCEIVWGANPHGPAPIRRELRGGPCLDPTQSSRHFTCSWKAVHSLNTIRRGLRHMP